VPQIPTVTHPDVVYGEVEDGIITSLLPGNLVMVARYAYEFNAFDFMPAYVRSVRFISQR